MATLRSNRRMTLLGRYVVIPGQSLEVPDEVMPKLAVAGNRFAHRMHKAGVLSVAGYDMEQHTTPEEKAAEEKALGERSERTTQPEPVVGDRTKATGLTADTIGSMSPAQLLPLIAETKDHALLDQLAHAEEKGKKRAGIVDALKQRRDALVKREGGGR